MKLSGKILVKYFVFSDVNFPNFQESFVIDEVLWVNKNIFRYKCFTVPFEPQPACK